MTMKENSIDWQVSTTTAIINALDVIDNAAPLSKDACYYYHNHQKLASTAISGPASFKKMKEEESRKLA